MHRFGHDACVNDTQIRTEIQKVITAHKLPQNENTEYILFTPLNSAAASQRKHFVRVLAVLRVPQLLHRDTGQIVYANMPWAYSVSGCDVNLAFSPTGYANGSAIDPEVGVLSHELIETMTDPNLNAWYDHQATRSVTSAPTSMAAVAMAR